MATFAAQDPSQARLVSLLVQSLEKSAEWNSARESDLKSPNLARGFRISTRPIKGKPKLKLRSEKAHFDQKQRTPPPVYKQNEIPHRPELKSYRSRGSHDGGKHIHGGAITDFAVSTSEIVRLVIGQALSMRMEEITDLDTIRELAGGLEIDTLIDLHAEFGPLPEDCENLCIIALSTSLEQTYDGRLGRHSSGIIARMIACTMPNSFSLAKVKKYLSDHWRLGPGSQDSVLISAVDSQPAVQLCTESEAKQFLDSFAQNYADTRDINLKEFDAESEIGKVDSTKECLESDSSTSSSPQHAGFNLDYGSPFETIFDAFAQSPHARVVRGDAKDSTMQSDAAKLLTLLQEWSQGQNQNLNLKQNATSLFVSDKIRTFDSSSNWALQDLYVLIFDIMTGRAGSHGRDLDHEASLISNRAGPDILKSIKYLSTKIAAGGHQKAHAATEDILKKLERYFEEGTQTVPAAVIEHAKIGLLDTIDEHNEDRNPEVDDYLSSRSAQTSPGTMSVVSGFSRGSRASRATRSSIVANALGNPIIKITSSSKGIPSPTLRTPASAGLLLSPSIYSTYSSPRRSYSVGSTDTLPPPYTPRALPRDGEVTFIRKKVEGIWDIDDLYTSAYSNTLDVAATHGMSFADKQVLITGATPDSIAIELVRNLLCGGARVIVASEQPTGLEAKRFRALYARHGARGSELVLVSFNQCSDSDAEALAKHIYDDMGWNLDHIFPFAAIAQYDDVLELQGTVPQKAREQMLANVVRLLNAIKNQKEACGLRNWPSQVMLPLLPSSGMFLDNSHDSALCNGLGSLFDNWYSESWNEYLSLCGVVIGMTDGTALLRNNSGLSREVKKMGAKIFSSNEMASNILGLMMPLMLGLTEREPIIADISGGLSSVAGLDEFWFHLRAGVAHRSALEENMSVEKAFGKAIKERKDTLSTQSSDIKYTFPQIPDYKTDISPISACRKNTVDLDRVVVVAGYAEIGPLGNARTRRQRELSDRLSAEACIELAWMMGLVKYSDHELIDVATGQILPTVAVREKYEDHILEHSGIRLVDESYQGKSHMQQFELQQNLPPFEASKDTAIKLEQAHGDKVLVFQHVQSDTSLVQLKKGAMLYFPKPCTCEEFIAGRVPDGWDPKLYGISDSVINQMARSDLHNLVATIEALLSAGITDPYELYKYVHVSDVNVMIGSAKSQTDETADKSTKAPDQKVAMQKALPSTVGGWVNLLLTGNGGKLISPSGFSAADSLHVGYETIAAGKAKVCLVGGANDIHGRKDVIESEGAGVQILTTARLALDMGLPIHAVIAHSHTATDSWAQGSGILGSVAKTQTKRPSPMLDLKYRHGQLERRLDEIDAWKLSELSTFQDKYQISSPVDAEETAAEVEYINARASRLRKDAQFTFGNAFWHGDERIAPLQGALATWGLTVDDITLASFHSDHTDLNESRIVNEQMTRLGRSAGNPVFAVFQKPVTGHAHAASAAWALNSCLQTMDSGLVPGDRSIDNVDATFRRFEHIMYPSRNIQTPGVDAFVVNSIEAGKSAQIVGVHPRFLFATIGEEKFAAYVDRRDERYREAALQFRSALAENRLFAVKERSPWPEAEMERVLMNPLARLV